jgi:septin family protein
MITTVQHNQRLEGLPGQSTFTVQFIVYDMEGFTNDLNEYCWKYFSEEFNDQLDKVLEKE